MSIDDREQCWLMNGRHQTYSFGVAIPALILYAMIIPLLTLVYFYSHKKVLINDRKLIFRFGLLFSGYVVSKFINFVINYVTNSIENNMKFPTIFLVIVKRDGIGKFL